MAKYITSSIPCIIVEDDTETSNIYKVATAEYELINMCCIKALSARILQDNI